MANLNECPDCFRSVKPDQTKCRCGKVLQTEVARELKCARCQSKDIYKYVKSEDIYLCYDHTQPQHRDFVHNMHDYITKHPGQHREAWNFAMQYEKHKLPESTYDRKPQSVRLSYNEADVIAEAEQRYGEPVRFDDLETPGDLR